MSVTKPQIPDHVFSTRFAEISRWDPVSFHTIEWGWPGLKRVKLSEFLTPRKQKIDQEVIAFSDMTLVTIHFDGSIEPRKVGEGKTYVMDMYSAKPGDIVVSKIDLKNGAVASLPDDWKNAAVTNHFAVYKPDLDAIYPPYFLRLIQAPFFKNYLWRNKVGAEGRKEVKLSFFENIEVPIPPVPEQKKIVERWTKAQSSIEASLDQVKRHRKSIISELLIKSGVSIELGTRKPKCFATSLSRTERWSVDFNRFEWTLESLLSGQRFRKAPLSEFAHINPTTPISFRGDDMVSFVPMAAVSDKNGNIFDRQTRKFSQVKTGYTRFSEDDVLWAKITPCMENGKSSVARDLIDGVGFGSTEFHVVRCKDSSQLLSDFIHLVLRLPEVRAAATRYFTGSAGQQRVPAEFLEGLHIPILSIELQQEIVNAASQASEAVLKLTNDVVQQRKDAEDSLEKVLLGTVSGEALS